MEQRYLVDVMSEAHQNAIDYNLTYIEGIVYNDIAYVEEHFGQYKTDNWKFLHLTEDAYYKALKHLQAMNLIIVSGNTATIKRWTREELMSDPIIATMMAAMVKQANLDVSFDPLEKFKKI